jgi:hypothetical protein
MSIEAALAAPNDAYLAGYRFGIRVPSVTSAHLGGLRE